MSIEFILNRLNGNVLTGRLRQTNNLQIESIFQ